MTKRRTVHMLLVVAIFFVIAPSLGSAQTPRGEAPAYRPGLGDLMTMTIQPRHTKLAFAGQEKNWHYAAYELHELQEAFERSAKVWPQWRSVPIAQMVVAVTQDPMAALAQAIKASDAAQFNAAFQQLTEACNACHQAVDRAVIVIQVPRVSMFPDQDFRPADAK